MGDFTFAMRQVMRDERALDAIATKGTTSQATWLNESSSSGKEAYPSWYARDKVDVFLACVFRHYYSINFSDLLDLPQR